MVAPQGGGYNNRGGYGRPQGGGYNNRGGYGRQHTPGYDPNAKYNLKKRIEYKEENIDPNEPLRLNKFLANAGICSRREADEFIQAGVVTVNGKVVTELGTKMLRTDEVKFHDASCQLGEEGLRASQQAKGLCDNKRRSSAAQDSDGPREGCLSRAYLSSRPS